MRDEAPRWLDDLLVIGYGAAALAGLVLALYLEARNAQWLGP